MDHVQIGRGRTRSARRRRERLRRGGRDVALRQALAEGRRVELWQWRSWRRTCEGRKGRCDRGGRWCALGRGSRRGRQVVEETLHGLEASLERLDVALWRGTLDGAFLHHRPEPLVSLVKTAELDHDSSQGSGVGAGRRDEQTAQEDAETHREDARHLVRDAQRAWRLGYGFFWSCRAISIAANLTEHSSQSARGGTDHGLEGLQQQLMAEAGTASLTLRLRHRSHARMMRFWRELAAESSEGGGFAEVEVDVDAEAVTAGSGLRGVGGCMSSAQRAGAVEAQLGCRLCGGRRGAPPLLRRASTAAIGDARTTQLEGSLGHGAASPVTL